MPLRNANGVTFIELLLAVAIIIMVIASLSMSMPKASQNLLNTRHRFIAYQLGNTQLENLKVQTYAMIPPTDVSQFSVGNSSCSCNSDRFTTIPSTVAVVSGFPLRWQECVNYVRRDVGTSWTAQCPAAGDTGYKAISVRVSWTTGSTPYFVTQESLKSSAL